MVYPISYMDAPNYTPSSLTSRIITNTVETFNW